MVSDGFQDSSRPGSPATTDSSVIALDGDPRLVKSELRDDSSEQTHKSPSPARPPSAAPSASAPAPITKSATAAAKPVSTAKPRSSKPKARSPSRSPPPPPPPAPIQTIRLDIGLGGPDNYAVDIADLARASGQRPLTPTNATTTAHSDSEDDDDKGTDREKGTDKDKKKKKKKNPTFEHYDISDPFIDDSELAIDERTYFAQTKQQGFYVSSGEVALLKDKSPKKPKSKNPLSVAASSKKGLSLPLSAVKNDAVVDHGAAAPGVSMSVSDDEKGPSTHAADEKVGEKRKRYITVVEGGKKRKVVDVVRIFSAHVRIHSSDWIHSVRSIR
ncbi:hypothetical protein C0993_008586 [Termitomyces sp. T159_Od127]|nr:hypothetical protein C0993_008586 [Termitomyces sp. T159_Od127]